MSEQVDVAVDDGFDTTALEPVITGRRLVRWTAIVSTAIVAILACWDGASVAHDGVRLTVHHDGRGAVWVGTTWQDGHPVGEPVSATMSARERDGATVRPVALRGQDPGSARYEGTLAAGTWTVTVDVARPATGTCTAVLTVGTAAAPDRVACDDSAPVATAAGVAGDAAAASGAGLSSQDASSQGPSGTMLIAAATVVVLLFAAAAAVLLRRR